MYENDDEREAIAKYNVIPVDTKWIDTEALEVEPIQLCETGQTSMRELLRWKL